MLILFAASLLISHCSFTCLILSSSVIISSYILSKRDLLKRKGLFDAKVVSITNKIQGFVVHFL